MPIGALYFQRYAGGHAWRACIRLGGSGQLLIRGAGSFATMTDVAMELARLCGITLGVGSPFHVPTDVIVTTDGGNSGASGRRHKRCKLRTRCSVGWRWTSAKLKTYGTLCLYGCRMSDSDLPETVSERPEIVSGVPRSWRQQARFVLPGVGALHCSPSRRRGTVRRSATARSSR
jgi:hypothetical protein